MDKKEIVAKFTEAGLLVSPEVLSGAEIKDIDTTIKNLKAKGTVFVTKNDLTQKVKVSIRSYRPKGLLKPGDFAVFYTSRYQALRKILEKKHQATSISNSNSGRVATIITMVKDLLPTGFVGEDPTGEIEVFAENEVGRDDVVAVTGSMREGKFYTTDIHFPETPIHKSERLQAEVSLENSGEEGNISFGGEKKHFSFPSKILLSGKVRIIAHRPDEQVEPKDAVKSLRKRHLGLNTPAEFSVIDPVPDIVWFAQENEWKQAHKGVLLVSGKKANINLETMD